MAAPLRVKLLHPDAVPPSRAHPGDVGYDLCSVESVPLRPTPTAVATGVAVQPPPGCYVRIAPRSGLALKGVWVNGGVVDPGYTGELRVILSGRKPPPGGLYDILPAGTKIAQLVVERVATPSVEVLPPGADFAATARADAGFGSTG